eukprot:gene6811-12402_t
MDQQNMSLEEQDDTNTGLNILSLAVIERSELSKEKKPQWRGIKGNNISKKNGKQTISHRHIEKRRRDRINNTLWMLKDIVPAAKLKYASGSGRLEKADLLEMTVHHLKNVHRSLAKVAEKQGESLSSKNSSALNEVYCNGFKDGIVHILNELKKMNLLTPTQTERLLKEQSKQNEAKAFQKEFSFSENEDDTNNIAREATEFEEDINRCVTDMNIPATDTVEEVTKYQVSIKAESSSPDLSPPVSPGEKICEQTSPEIKNPVPDADPKSVPCIPRAESLFKNMSIPADSGYNCPVLVPAYALHASGTHYVPVLLPPTSLFPTNSQCGKAEGSVLS